jgi:hypothetical protein
MECSMSSREQRGMDQAVRQSLEKTREALAAALAEIDAQLGAADGIEAVKVGLGPDWITPGQAAFLCRRTDETIRRWCEAHGIGKRHGGRWYVSRQRLRAFLGA